MRRWMLLTSQMIDSEGVEHVGGGMFVARFKIAGITIHAQGGDGFSAVRHGYCLALRELVRKFY